jgi:hypothetical protein
VKQLPSLIKNQLLDEGENLKKPKRRTIVILFLVLLALGVIGFVGYPALSEFIRDTLMSEIVKPVIYLYPESETDVHVSLDIDDGEFTCTYPEYGGGWSVTAKPDGTLINHADGEEYSYLFWDADTGVKFTMPDGFLVKREDTESFLREKLCRLGLIPREYNEFIVYWLPILQENEYNLIRFAGEEYTNTAPLTITPAPDSVLRVFMVSEKADGTENIPEQELHSFEREGFTVVEWGGTEIRD